MQNLFIDPANVSSVSPIKAISTPSQLPKTKPSVVSFVPSQSRPSKSPKKTPSRDGAFMNKDSNVRMPDWDLGSRVQNMESMYADLKASLSTSTAESNGLRESMVLYKARGRFKTD